MGVVFLEAMDDPDSSRLVYDCKNCKAYLTNGDQLKSTQFQSGNGQAFLFEKVVNITSGKAERRTMMTGHHYVRDVHCKSCNEKLGWVYEFAYRKSQQYKEGKIILETAQLRQS